MVRKWVVLVWVFVTFSAIQCTEVPKTDLILTSASDPETDEATVEDATLASETNFSDVFQPTQEWQEIRPGQVIPRGLHVRINLETGKKEAKLLTDDNGRAESLRKIDDGGAATGNKSDGLRNYQDLQEMKAQQSLKFNTEFEKVQFLVDHYSNSTHEQRIAILDDIEYYLHQYDNARDFVTIGGLDSIVKTALESESEDIRSAGAMVFSACVQSHHDVKEKVLSGGWAPYLIGLLEKEPASLTRRRLVHSLGCLVRGHSRSFQEFGKSGGIQAFLRLLSASPSEEKLQFKILTIFADVFENAEQVDPLVKKDASSVCQLVCGFVSQMTADNLDLVEKVTDILHVFRPMCNTFLQKMDATSIILKVHRALASQTNSTQEDDPEMNQLLEKLLEISSMLQQEKDEL